MLPITEEVTTEYFRALSHYARTVFRHFRSQDDNGFLKDVSVIFIGKTDPSDLLKCENCWRETLTTMASYGLNFEEVSNIDHSDNIEVIIGIFNFAFRLYCMDYWKMNLFSHYFI